EFLRTRPEIGLVMPRVLNPDGSIQFLCKQLPSPMDLILRRFLPSGLRTLVGQRLKNYELRDVDYTRPLLVPALSGCFMMMSRAAIAEVGGFDERFFMYLEDVDLCRRIRLRYKTVYMPDVSIYHHYAKGSYRKVWLLLHHIMSAARYFH